MIDAKIAKLGDKFRGLWQIRELKNRRRKRRYGKRKITWYVTFKYDGEMLETEAQDTIEEALDYAINFLGL